MSTYLDRIALAADLSEFAGENGIPLTEAEAMALVSMTDDELNSILTAFSVPTVKFRRIDIRRAAAWVVAFRTLSDDEQDLLMISAAFSMPADQAVRNVQQLAEQDRDPDYPRN
jgi:hypothetical protein